MVAEQRVWTVAVVAHKVRHWHAARDAVVSSSMTDSIIFRCRRSQQHRLSMLFSDTWCGCDEHQAMAEEQDGYDAQQQQR